MIIASAALKDRATMSAKGVTMTKKITVSNSYEKLTIMNKAATCH